MWFFLWMINELWLIDWYFHFAMTSQFIVFFFFIIRIMVFVVKKKWINSGREVCGWPFMFFDLFSNFYFVLLFYYIFVYLTLDMRISKLNTEEAKNLYRSCKTNVLYILKFVKVKNDCEEMWINHKENKNT